MQLSLSLSLSLSGAPSVQAQAKQPPTVTKLTSLFFRVVVLLAQSLSETWEADGGMDLSSTSSSDGQRANNEVFTTVGAFCNVVPKVSWPWWYSLLPACKPPTACPTGPTVSLATSFCATR